MVTWTFKKIFKNVSIMTAKKLLCVSYEVSLISFANAVTPKSSGRIEVFHNVYK